jgi:oxygen-independent coproporphyrinogen-3 oxidase
MSYGVYVHVPWCVSRCHYCSFNVRVQSDRPTAAYTRAVLSQWAHLAPRFSGAPDTLYFGGGTPSLHPPDLLADWIREVAPTGEVTIEANPESTSPERIAQWQQAGVTRVSVGVQTLNPDRTRFLNRAHNTDQARAVLKHLPSAGLNSWSMDLIFALPDQDLAELDRELDELLTYAPPHVSLYALTPHPGTPFADGVDRGRWTLPDEDAWADQYEHIVARLGAAGLARYEVSNFAKPGHRGQHNEGYWLSKPYAGLGAGAHGRLPDGTRTLCHKDPDHVIERPERFAVWESATLAERALERLGAGIRHVDGVRVSELERLGQTLPEGALAQLQKGGFLLHSDNRIALAPAGWLVADAIAARLAAELIPAVA